MLNYDMYLLSSGFYICKFTDNKLWELGLQTTPNAKMLFKQTDSGTCQCQLFGHVDPVLLPPYILYCLFILLLS